MSKEAKIWFSREHTSKSHPENHYDVYRQASDKSRAEKIDHVPAPENKVDVTVVDSSSGHGSNSGK